MRYSLDLIEPIVAKNLCGINNTNLKILEELFDCSIDFHCNSILSNVSSELEEKLIKIIDLLVEMANSLDIVNKMISKLIFLII